MHREEPNEETRQKLCRHELNDRSRYWYGGLLFKEVCTKCGLVLVPKAAGHSIG